MDSKIQRPQAEVLDLESPYGDLSRMYSLLWTLIFFVSPVLADLESERVFYQRFQKHLEGPIPVLTPDDHQRIDQLKSGDIEQYARILFDRWLSTIDPIEARVLEFAFRQVNFVGTEEYPDLSFRARANAWGQIDLLMPTRLRSSVLYYKIIFHELDHCRQGCAVFEAFDLEYNELFGKTHFWAKFESEKSAMSLEWYFIHHLPEWGRVALARELDQITPQDALVHFEKTALNSASLSREEYLQAQWNLGRYSWEVLHQECESALAHPAVELREASR